MLKTSHDEQKSVLVVGVEEWEEGHAVTNGNSACFHTSPITQPKAVCSFCDVLATQPHEFPGSLHLLNYSNQ